MQDYSGCMELPIAGLKVAKITPKSARILLFGQLRIVYFPNTKPVYGIYMARWLHGYMATWLHGIYMAKWLHGIYMTNPLLAIPPLPHRGAMAGMRHRTQTTSQHKSVS